MRALVIGQTERARIAELRTLAAANPIDPLTAQAAAEKDMAAFRDFMGNMAVELPVGYHVAYSHERQPIGVCHHISISVDRAGKVPHPAAVEMILGEFGMAPMGQSVCLWIEDVGPTIKAINIVQLVAHHANRDQAT